MLETENDAMQTSSVSLQTMVERTLDSEKKTTDFENLAISPPAPMGPCWLSSVVDCAFSRTHVGRVDREGHRTMHLSKNKESKVEEASHSLSVFGPVLRNRGCFHIR